MQEESVDSTQHNVVIAIQPIGLVCFKGSETNEIESKQALLYLLPLEAITFNEKGYSEETPACTLALTYKNDRMPAYNLIFRSKPDVKLFLKECKEQININ
jgi:hypothetical protein